MPKNAIDEYSVAPRPVDVRDYARRYTVTAMRTLTKVAMFGKSEAAKVAAANAILDRGWGKPAQAIILETPEAGKVIDMISNASDHADTIMMTPLMIDSGTGDEEMPEFEDSAATPLQRARSEIGKAVKSSRRRLFPDDEE